jgi:predicted PurR-regulated permease PerM
MLNNRLKRKNLSASIVSLLIILLILVPTSIALYHLSKEASIGYIVVKQKLLNPSKVECGSGYLCSTFTSFKEFISKPEIKFYIEDSLNKISSQISQSIMEFIFTIPRRALDLLLTFFFTFFLLRDGESIINKIEKSALLEQAHKERVIKQIRRIIHAIVYGFFVIAIIEGVLGALTFKLFNVSSPLTWGFVIAFLTFVPFIGASIIWIPAVLVQLSYGMIGNAVGITVGGLIIGYIDTFVKPRVIGKKAEIHPTLILVGMLGGFALMGFAGFIIGPVILSLCVMFIETYLKQNETAVDGNTK